MFSDKNTPPEFRPANSTGTGGSPYNPYTKENTKSSVLRLLSYSLVINLIGFGSCTWVYLTLGFRKSFTSSLIVIPIVSYLFAGLLSFRSILLAHKAFDVRWKVVLAQILALTLGGWGFFWGVQGLLILFGF